jgi:hypothetical protein
MKILTFGSHNLKLPLTINLISYQSDSRINKIAISDRKGFKFVRMDDVIFIEADGNYSKFVLASNQVLSKPMAKG